MSLTRASRAVNCQSIVAWRWLRSSSKARTRCCKVAVSGTGRERQPRSKILISISAWFSQLPCLGVEWNSSRSRGTGRSRTRRYSFPVAGRWHWCYLLFADTVERTARVVSLRQAVLVCVFHIANDSPEYIYDRERLSPAATGTLVNGWWPGISRPVCKKSRPLVLSGAKGRKTQVFPFPTSPQGTEAGPGTAPPDGIPRLLRWPPSRLDETLLRPVRTQGCSKKPPEFTPCGVLQSVTMRVE